MREMGYEVSKQLSHGPTDGLIEISDAWVKVEKLPGGRPLSSTPC
jgi:hypothetical protein